MDDKLKALNDFFSFFESRESFTELSLINTLSSLVLHIRYSTVFSNAKNTVISNQETGIPIVIERVEKLLNERTVRKYRNGYDGALAADILLLSETSTKGTELLIEKITSKRLENLWWTNLMVEYAKKIITSTKSLESDLKFDDVEYKSAIKEEISSSQTKVLHNSITFI